MKIIINGIKEVVETKLEKEIWGNTYVTTKPYLTSLKAEMIIIIIIIITIIIIIIIITIIITIITIIIIILIPIYYTNQHRNGERKYVQTAHFQVIPDKKKGPSTVEDVNASYAKKKQKQKQKQNENSDWGDTFTSSNRWRATFFCKSPIQKDQSATNQSGIVSAKTGLKWYFRSPVCNTLNFTIGVL